MFARMKITRPLPSSASSRLHLPLAACMAAVALLAIGCQAFDTNKRQRHNSSLVDYLYPSGNHDRATKPSVPTLSLPLKVGIAWVPESTGSKDQHRRPDTVLTEARRKELAEAVIPHFQKYSFIKSIEIIPTAYLTPGGGFENLDQLRALLGVDVVALLSFDQLQTSDSTEFSVLYWTIVGAYFIPAEANQTHTMVDAAVFDIASRQLLFRAPGTSKSQGHSTLVRTEERLRAKSDEGFVAAATNMVANLQVELAAFQQRVKDKPESVRIVRQPGYTGGGALGWEHAGLLGGVVLLGMLLQRPRA
ncbi:MAG: rhombotarget lipoprotein [Verrucomicrobia bacterium]|nr:rhombotarget lipoprotein [Verrucomicrobiota bacterium]NDB77854.1 rhombotarget lipoprotein [Verrucomicrobiota bacterium]